MKSKNNDSFLSISSSDDISNNKENNISKEDIYHNIFKGITSKSETFNPKKSDTRDNNKEKEELNKKYILQLRKKLKNNITKTNDKKLLILPAPENDLIDNHYHNKNILDDEEINCVSFIFWKNGLRKIKKKKTSIIQQM